MKTHDVTVWWEDHSEMSGDNLSAAGSPGALTIRTSLKRCIVRRRDVIERTP